jgi:hypothetical protein
MIRGSFLCGGVKFEISDAAGPFELCHCSRCRKVTGSAYLPGLRVRRESLRFVEGTALIATYEAPILERPPAYRSCFCSRCGSPVPDPGHDSTSIDIAAGLLDDDPAMRPERHIFVDLKAPWSHIDDGLPQFSKAAIREFRRTQLP